MPGQNDADPMAFGEVMVWDVTVISTTAESCIAAMARG